MLKFSCCINCFKQHECQKKKLSEDERFENFEEGEARNLDDDELDYLDIRVPRIRLKKLNTSQKIKKLLENQKLRDVIKRIDSSKFRLRELNEEMRDNEYFFSFAQDLLKETGYLDENGCFKEN